MTGEIIKWIEFYYLKIEGIDRDIDNTAHFHNTLGGLILFFLNQGGKMLYAQCVGLALRT